MYSKVRSLQFRAVVSALANEVKGSALSPRACQINETLLCNKEITRIAHASSRVRCR